jgi:glycosyltransferase involved in cell wall biosynthesis
MNRKKISIVSSCFNEVENLRELHARIVRVFEGLPDYDFEIIIADNLSTDGSRELLRELAAGDKRLKVILNANNFGHIRSPFNALLQASGDAAVMMCSDLQDPPELLPEFIAAWERGNQVVCAVKPVSRENPLMFFLRRCYYKIIARFSETEQIQNFYGFGLYDRKFVDALKLFDDPYPYFRGLIGEIGLKRIEIPFVQEKRKHGRTKNNFFTLYDMAMTGFVNHTKMPLRLAMFCGFVCGGLSLLIALGYLVWKLMYWDTFSLGLAPLIIGLFFFSAVQLIFIGIIGEYLGAVWTQVKNRPLVIEEERINFE